MLICNAVASAPFINYKNVFVAKSCKSTTYDDKPNMVLKLNNNNCLSYMICEVSKRKLY